MYVLYTDDAEKIVQITSHMSRLP